MAQANHYRHEEASLRAINYRIASTPTKQLPHIVSQLASTLWNCRRVLSVKRDSQRANNEVATSVHRFKTSLTSLLQDRSIEGRWSAVVLTKATIEAGGIETLSYSGRWIKSLLTVLKKPDPPTTRSLAISTLTRVFMLTWEDSNLVRELTTPNLPTFVLSCLQIVDSDRRRAPSELRMVLEAFAVLLPKHPTIFRTYESQIRSLVLKILSSSPQANESSIHYAESHNLAARELLALLPQCAPKQASGEKWFDTVQVIIFAAHETCDQFFRSIVEDESLASRAKQISNHQGPYSGEMARVSQDSLGLAPWQGIHAGRERLELLVLMLESHFNTSVAGTVAIPLGQVMGFATRVLGVRIPTSDVSKESNINSQVSRDERETVYSLVPSVHAVIIDFLHTLVTHVGAAILPIVGNIMDLALNVFATEYSHDGVRSATYSLVGSLMNYAGASMTKQDVADLSLVMRACCNDLLPQSVQPPEATTRRQVDVGFNRLTSNKNGRLSSNIEGPYHTAQATATRLLTVLLSSINPSFIPQKSRSQIERTAILTHHHDAMISCIMNPARKDDGQSTKPSPLPFLARMFPESGQVEATIRPRMPLVATQLSVVDSDAEPWYNGHEEESDGSRWHDNTSAVKGEASMVELDNGVNDASVSNARTSMSLPDAEDLYTATPPPIDADSLRDPTNFATQGSPLKRVAEPSAHDSISAKRLRPSTVAEALQSEQIEPRPETSIATNDPPVSHAAVPDGSSAVLPVSAAQAEQARQSGLSSTHATAQSITGTNHVKEKNDDDSEFEIPPINVDPDTESDEESDGMEELASSPIDL